MSVLFILDHNSPLTIIILVCVNSDFKKKNDTFMYRPLTVYALIKLVFRHSDHSSCTLYEKLCIHHNLDI